MGKEWRYATTSTAKYIYHHPLSSIIIIIMGRVMGKGVWHACSYCFRQVIVHRHYLSTPSIVAQRPITQVLTSIGLLLIGHPSIGAQLVGRACHIPPPPPPPSIIIMGRVMGKEVMRATTPAAAKHQLTITTTTTTITIIIISVMGK